MSKVPCGGFKLDENFLGMNENEELSLVGGGSEGKAYQYVVTDGEGSVKWEDRLAYDDSRVVVDVSKYTHYVKVSDEVPSWASLNVPIKTWADNNDNVIGTTYPEDYIDCGNGSFATMEVLFVMTDNAEIDNGANKFVIPEKGVYFLSTPAFYVSGLASADSDTPEITWDGNIGTLKTIDPKYIPSELNEIILPSSTSGSTKKFKITVNDNGAITATEVTT